MKVQPRKGRSLGREVPQGRLSGPSREPLEATSFLATLRRTIDTRDEESLALAFAAIEGAASTLRQSMTLYNLRQYKALIRAFIGELAANAYSVLQETGFDQHGQRRLYIVIREIDQRLENLTREVVRGQMDTLDLVGRLDEIKGLLFDIYS